MANTINKIYVEEFKDWVNDSQDLRNGLCEQLDEFIFSEIKGKEGMVIPLDELDESENIPDGAAYQYSDKAWKLIQEEIKELEDIFHKYYPDEGITIRSIYIME